MSDIESLHKESGLTIERLLALHRLASSKSLLDAAGGDRKRANVLSRLIQELSKYFGTELTDREGQFLALSESGRDLVPIVSDFLTRILDFKSRIAGQPMKFSLGAGESILYSLVIPRLPKLLDNSQGATIDLFPRWDKAIVENIVNHTLDFGIVAEEHCVEALARKKLGTTSYVLIVPTRLLAKHGLSATDPEKDLLEKLPLVSQHRASFFHVRMLERARAAGIRPNFKLYCDSAAAAMLSLMTGRFAGFVHSLAEANIPEGGFTRIELPVATVTPKLVLVWKAARLEARQSEAHHFLNHLFQTLRFPPPK